MPLTLGTLLVEVEVLLVLCLFVVVVVVVVDEDDEVAVVLEAEKLLVEVERDDFFGGCQLVNRGSEEADASWLMGMRMEMKASSG